MSHLSPSAFVDVLDGAVAETDVPHLASCAPCRQQLEALRAAWHSATNADVPEPSPLFWNHLSSNIRDAVAREPRPVAFWWRIEWSWRVAGLASATVAAVVVAFMLRPPAGPLVNTGSEKQSVETSMVASVIADGGEPLPDDDSLGFVADLASGLDWDGVSALGLVARGGADEAAAEINEGERVELRRLLNEALASGV